MEALSYTLAGDDTLHVHVNGVSKAVKSDASHYDDVMLALREKRWEDVAGLLNPLSDIEAADDRFKTVHGVVVLIDDNGETFNAPTLLSEEIRRYTKLRLDFNRLVIFAKNLNLNPSYHSVQQLFGWIKTTNLTITEDGYFIAYKGVKFDWTDHRTGTMDNSIGKMVKMNRNQVDEDPDNSCSSGIHCGTYEFAHSGWGYGDSHVVAVKVHPKDVVAVPNSEHEKMRVCEYLVLEESVDGSIKRPTYEEPTSEDEEPEEPEDCEEDVCDCCDMYESDCYCDEDE